MADLFQLESGLTESSSPSGISPASNSLSTGDLRRKYNFGERVSELQIAQDPFFRFLSKVAKKPTDDPEFKFTERRPSYHKRYSFATAFSNDNSTWVENQSSNQTTQYDKYETAGSIVYVKLACDYKKDGNIQNVYGQTGNDTLLGDDGTQPQFILEGKILKVNF